MKINDSSNNYYFPETENRIFFMEYGAFGQHFVFVSMVFRGGRAPSSCRLSGLSK